MLRRALNPLLTFRRAMKIVTERVLADNYMYYVIDTTTRQAFVVDLGDVSRVSACSIR